MRTVADVSDVLASEVLPDVVKAAGVLQPKTLSPVDARIDLAPLRRVTPAVVVADERLRAESERMLAVDSSQLVSQLAGPVRQLQEGLEGTTELSSRASRAVRLLPPMLGADGERRYLLMFQNNAEIRATGGIPGALAVVTADNGKLRIARQSTATSIGRFDRSVLPLTSAERGLFGDKLGVFPADVTFTPDFPRTAELIQAMWKARTGTSVDGVLSTDPVALAQLLRGTGPLQVGGGRSLTADDAVRVLLNQVYLENPDPVRQNAYFAQVARKAFGALTSSQGSPSDVLDALVASTYERRVLVWSSDPAEQAVLAPTLIGGALTRSSGQAPQVGVYLNDGSQAKLNYYLDYQTDVRSRSCAGGRQQLTVRMLMRSRVPHRARGLSPSVVSHAPGVPRGTMRTTVMVYVPVDGEVGDATINGQPLPLSPRRHAGRSMVAHTVNLAPGQRLSTTYEMTSGPGQTDRTDLRVTPGVRGDGVGTVTPSSCPVSDLSRAY